MSAIERIDILFAFKIGDRVKPKKRHDEHDRHVGTILERRYVESHQGGKGTVQYVVRWTSPDGNIDKDTIIHAHFEIEHA